MALKRTHLFDIATIVTFLVIAVPRAESQIAVTTCGQIVKGDAYLASDLVCAMDVEAAVELEGGSLDLRGFTISGAEYGVFCAKEVEGTAAEEELYRYLSCRIYGGGTISGQSVLGIDGKKLVVDDVTVESDAIAIIAHRRLKFTNVTLQLGPNALGVYGTSRARIDGTNLTLTGGTNGIAFTKKVRIDGVGATGYSNQAISAEKVDLRNGSLTGGSIGVGALKARIEASVITGHSAIGVSAGSMKIFGSTITGNALDLHSDRLPHLEGSTCDSSNGWGVCSGD